jgi:hypothetical protein
MEMIRKVCRWIVLLVFGLLAFGETKPQPVFNVRAFGATGDGTTKDTAAFQKTLDTCAVSGGGEVIKVAPEKPLLGLFLTNITWDCQKEITSVNVPDDVLGGIKVTGFSGPLLAIDNTTGSGLQGAGKYK